ncbi:MAG: response regulator [Cytophagales bacterium]|nr:response regulator [Cytophaga sp.]
MKLKVDWVLLVDDDEIHNFIHQKILKKYLQEDCIQVAYNGEQAILLLQSKIQQEIHLQNGIIFLDINMPVMNGFQFIEAFKKNYKDLFPHTRILPLSSSEHMDDIIQMNALGVEGYLVKPLTHELASEFFL